MHVPGHARIGSCPSLSHSPSQTLHLLSFKFTNSDPLRLHLSCDIALPNSITSRRLASIRMVPLRKGLRLQYNIPFHPNPTSSCIFDQIPSLESLASVASQKMQRRSTGSPAVADWEAFPHPLLHFRGACLTLGVGSKNDQATPSLEYTRL
jgi:hypothetical protein